MDNFFTSNMVLNILCFTTISCIQFYFFNLFFTEFLFFLLEIGPFSSSYILLVGLVDLLKYIEIEYP